MSRSTGWDRVWNDIVIEEYYCESPDPESDFPKDCDVKIVGITFMFTYLAAVTAMTLMMYSVILYNYLQVKRCVQKESNKDDFDNKQLNKGNGNNDGNETVNEHEA